MAGRVLWFNAASNIFFYYWMQQTLLVGGFAYKHIRPLLKWEWKCLLQVIIQSCCWYGLKVRHRNCCSSVLLWWSLEALPVKARFKTVSGFQPLAFKVPLLLDNGERRLQSTLWRTSEALSDLPCGTRLIQQGVC